MSIYIYIFLNDYLYRQIRVSNILYAYFMLIIEISEYFLQNDDDIICVTKVTGITGYSFITKYRRSDIL